MSTPDESQLPLDIPITYAPRQGRQPLNRSGPHALLAQAQRRMVSLIILATGFFLILSLRLIDATLLQPAHTQQASLGPAQPGEKHPLRADILDRNGEVLATSLPTQSLYADPARLIDPVATARGLVETLPGLKYEETLDKLTSSRRFVWIKRNLSPMKFIIPMRWAFPVWNFRKKAPGFIPPEPPLPTSRVLPMLMVRAWAALSAGLMPA
jgi:cell division protein FtsI (penicillin-binding protein 3)